MTKPNPWIPSMLPVILLLGILGCKTVQELKKPIAAINPSPRQVTNNVQFATTPPDPLIVKTTVTLVNIGWNNTNRLWRWWYTEDRKNWKVGGWSTSNSVTLLKTNNSLSYGAEDYPYVRKFK